MNFKEAVEKELEINSKITYEEASLRIDDLKEKTFNNVRTEWKKGIKKNNGNLGNDGKKSKVYPKTELKEDFQEGTLDRELIEMTDIELIRHTCRKIIATKINEPRIKLQASNILLSFVEKSGSIKEFMPDNEMNLQKKFKSMTTEDLIEIISNDGVDQHTKEEAMSYSVSKEHMFKEKRENING